MIESREIENVVVITVPESLDAYNAETFTSTLSDLMAQNQTSIVVDLSRTEFIDSSGLSSLVVKLPPVRSRGGDIRLVFTQAHIEHQLSVTKLDEVFRCFETIESAVASFS